MTRKILVLKSTPALPVTGANISMFERLQLLKALHGWEAAMFSVSLSDKLQGTFSLANNLGLDARAASATLSLQYKDVPCTLAFEAGCDGYNEADYPNIGRVFDRIVESERPDLLIGNLRDRAVLDYLPRQNRPHVFFLTELSFPSPEELALTRRGTELEGLVRAAGPLIVASDFVKQRFSASWGIEPRVFLNAVNVDSYHPAGASNRQYYTMLQPYRAKGVEIFLALADLCKDRRFQITGGFGPEFRSLLPRLRSIPNLTVIPFNTSVRDVYSQSRAVLVPSLCEEAFGRVVIEALASQTPVIASSVGALRETGGTAAKYIDVSDLLLRSPPDARHLKAWLSEIKELDDNEKFQSACRTARDFAGEYKARLAQSMSEMSGFFGSLIS